MRQPCWVCDELTQFLLLEGWSALEAAVTAQMAEVLRQAVAGQGSSFLLAPRSYARMSPIGGVMSQFRGHVYTLFQHQEAQPGVDGNATLEALGVGNTTLGVGDVVEDPAWRRREGLMRGWREVRGRAEPQAGREGHFA